MNNNTLRIGTRKSRLAMVQTEIVREVILAHFPFLEIEIVPMSTKGDKILDRSLTSFGGKGVFTKELEDALINAYAAVGVKLNHHKAVSLITTLRSKRMIVQENGRKYTFMPDFHY